MAWAPDTSEHIDTMFASLSVFDVWEHIDVYRVDTSEEEPRKVSHREKARLDMRARRANALAVRMRQYEILGALIVEARGSGMSVEQIATELGWGIRTVYKAASRAKAGLPINVKYSGAYKRMEAA